MSMPSSPAGGSAHPLQPVSHNAQRDSSLFTTGQQSRERVHLAEGSSLRDSSVHEKINQFNTLAMQSKQLERKTADAALKRAMLGREEAEAEMRRYRDEAIALRKQVEEGKARERKVGERLEAVMENYGRAKETHAHTQQLWEKEIRRARKETFKAQSALVKLQEELKSCRAAQKAVEEELQAERERSKAREQEAFDARYSLAGLQEELDQTLGRVRMLEQELDALKTLAKHQDQVRRLSSMKAADEEDAPRKRPRLSDLGSPEDESEVENLMMLWEWERQRADRALEQVQFLEVECQLKVCAAGKALRARRSSPRRKRGSLLAITDAGDQMILSESRRASRELAEPTPRRSKTDLLRTEKEPRRSTIFFPAEGIFRTVSQAEADALAVQSATSSIVSPTDSAPSMPITPTDSDPMYRRTPSVDPPDFAVLTKERTSLLSLLNAPHRQDPVPAFNIPTTPGPDPEAQQPGTEDEPEAPSTVRPSHLAARELAITPPEPAPSHVTGPLTDPLPATHAATTALNTSQEQTRPHTTASHYAPTAKTATVTTTKVPLREEPRDGPTLAQRLLKMQRTPSRQQQQQQQQLFEDGEPALDRPSFDATNPALTPTMTREQALAQIRERRGRARSVGRVAATSGSGPANGAGPAASGGGGGSSSGGGIGGAGNGGQAARRKISAEAVGPGQQQQSSRGREREREPVRREVSAPTASGAAGGTMRSGGGVVAGLRRVRS